MKNNKLIVRGMLAVLLASGLVLSGCGDDGSNDTPWAYLPDIIAPVVTGAVIEDIEKNVLKVSFSEAVTGVSAADWTVTGSPKNITVSGASGSGANWTLTLSRLAVNGEKITLAYSGATVVDAVGNALAGFTGNPVTNNAAIVGSPYDHTEPLLATAVIAYDAPNILILTFSEPVIGVSAAGFTVTGSPANITINRASGSGTIWALTLSRLVVNGEAITLAYNGSAIKDTATSPPNALAAFSDKAVTNQFEQVISPFTGLYTSGNKTISFSDTNWAVKIGENWSDGSIYVEGIINGTTPQYVVNGNTATWTAVGTGSGLGGTATLSGNTLTVSSGNPAINGTYTKQAGGPFRIKVTGIPSNVISLISQYNPSAKIRVGISEPGSLIPTDIGHVIAARDTDPAGWGDIIDGDSYECWMYGGVGARVYYFGSPGYYDIRFLAESLSVYKYRSMVPLQINETNIIPYSSFTNFTVSPKTFVITGITEAQKTVGQSGFMIGVFRGGTTPEQAISQINLVVGFDGSGDNFSISGGSAPYTATINNLYADWTGINTCDLYAMLGSGGSMSYYRKTGVISSSTSINVNMATFEQITF
ncbi:putative outer membrane protein [Treponema primitia ZAS-2]|uniref:Putative outer membrane protein n=1 Tax=Treponema primitia (strain ATCC BAA-887 / DSM 12427 / ZAS-2) TaxID=545694 RepID=F5YGY3_TREPZ|nr:SwmB domain-containing protein [Treponema primitia]AEF84588.1 putative outer membrane protein [Treponema primitia ZAS-2]